MAGGFGGSVFLGDFLGGFNKTSDEIRQRNTDQQNKDRDRETHIASLLLNHPDATPELRAAALTSLTTQPTDKASGLGKWFGKQQSHPLFPAMQSLVGGTGAQDQGQGGPGPSTPPPTSTGGQKFDETATVTPSGTTVTPGGTPPSPPPPPSAGGGPTPPPSTAGIRAFRTPEERIRSETEAHYDAELYGSYLSLKRMGEPDADARRHALERFHGQKTPPRQATNIKYQDDAGNVKTKAVFADAGGKFYNPDGSEVTEEPLAVSRTGKWDSDAKTTGKGIDSYEAETKDHPLPAAFRGKNMRWKVHYTPDGQEVARVPSQYYPPPVFGSVVQTPEGLTGVTRGGTAQPVPGGAGVSSGISPEAYATQLGHLKASIDSQALAESKFGSIVDPKRLAAAKDKKAKEAGFPDYATLAKAHGDATVAVGSAVKQGGGPPAAAGLPAAAAQKGKKAPAKRTPGTINPGDVLKELQRTSGGAQPQL